MTTYRRHTEISDVFSEVTYRSLQIESHIFFGIQFQIFGPETFINFKP